MPMPPRYVPAFGLLVCVLIPACSLLGTEDAPQDRLETYRNEWKTRGLSSYQYELHRTCFCVNWLYPALIEVRDDTVSAVLDPKTGNPLRSPHTGDLAIETAPNAYLTVDGLFDIVERAIEEEYHRLNVEYNDYLGFPHDIDLEVGKDVTDDRETYVVEEFEGG